MLGAQMEQKLIYRTWSKCSDNGAHTLVFSGWLVCVYGYNVSYRSIHGHKNVLPYTYHKKQYCHYTCQCFMNTIQCPSFPHRLIREIPNIGITVYNIATVGWFGAGYHPQDQNLRNFTPGKSVSFKRLFQSELSFIRHVGSGSCAHKLLSKPY